MPLPTPPDPNVPPPSVPPQKDKGIAKPTTKGGTKDASLKRNVKLK